MKKRNVLITIFLIMGAASASIKAVNLSQVFKSTLNAAGNLTEKQILLAGIATCSLIKTYQHSKDLYEKLPVMQKYQKKLDDINSQYGHKKKKYAEKKENLDEKYKDRFRELRQLTVKSAAWASLAGFCKYRVCGVPAGMLWTYRSYQEIVNLTNQDYSKQNESQVFKAVMTGFGWAGLGLTGLIVSTATLLKTLNEK